MDINGRAEYIEDYLVQLHTGQWFGWSDSKNKVYANLIILDDSKNKPTEQACTNGLATLQSNFDNKEYQRNRAKEYPAIGDQLDMLWHSIDEDASLKSKYFAFHQAILAIKSKYSK